VQHHRLTVEQTRFKNRLQTLLDTVWPEFMGHFSNLTKRAPLAILERWPLPQDLAAASPRTVARFIKKVSRNHIKPEKISALIGSARNSVGLTDGLEERRAELQYLFARWRLLREQMREIETKIEALVEVCPEALALTSVPEGARSARLRSSLSSVRRRLTNALPRSSNSRG